MKAVIINQYGSPNVLQYGEIAVPKIKPDQVLVKIKASSINPIDWKIRRGYLKWIAYGKFPMILGFDLAGEVVEIGSSVNQFQLGDLIYGFTNQFPGQAYAEYAAINPDFFSIKPKQVELAESAVIPLAAITALQGLRDWGNIKPNQKVLINGGSGGVGIFAIQIAKVFNAEVTTVCSGKNIELVRSLGSDYVIDYSQTDFTKQSIKYDLVFDIVSNLTFSNCLGILNPLGRYVGTNFSLDTIIRSTINFMVGGKQGRIFLAKSNRGDLDYLTQLIDNNQLKIIIDRSYPLSEMVDAHTYAETNRTVGKVMILVN